MRLFLLSLACLVCAEAAGRIPPPPLVAEPVLAKSAVPVRVEPADAAKLVLAKSARPQLADVEPVDAAKLVLDAKLVLAESGRPLLGDVRLKNVVPVRVEPADDAVQLEPAQMDDDAPAQNSSEPDDDTPAQAAAEPDDDAQAAEPDDDAAQVVVEPAEPAA